MKNQKTIIRRRRKVKMKSKKSLVILGLLAGMLVFFTLTSQVLAGGAGIEPPPAGAVISGPEIWGVVVMYCGPGTER